MTYDVEINGRARRVHVERTAEGLVVTVDGRSRRADVTLVGGVWSLIIAPARGEAPPRSYQALVDQQPSGPGGLIVRVDGTPVAVSIGLHKPWSRRGHDGGIAGDASPRAVTAPMPGKVVKVLVRVGDAVTARQGIVVVEAMKMENELRAPKAGTVSAISVTEGASVEAGAVLAVIE